ncbi:MAG: hypothetical protein E7391_00040 [Ruminococcaceae bacterium]|nr:hypothetical protein [Oscillospiraceae bacterium]
MKKILCLVLSILMVISSFSMVVFANDEISVIVNGKKLVMDQSPIIVEGRTLVPLRAIFEALGATVEWDDATKTASGKLGAKTVSLQINNTVAKVNGADVTLDVPAQIVNSRTLVPVRFISESLGALVGWNGDTRTVTVTLASSNDNLIFYEDFETAGVKIGDKLKDTIGTAAAFGMVPTYDSNAKEGAKSIKCTLSEGKTANLGCKLYLTSDAKNKLVDGQTYTLSAYVYFDSQVSGSGKVYIKTLNGTGAKEVVKGKAQTANKGEWTLITNTFVYEAEKYPDGLNIRIDTLEIGAGSLYYVDEVKISKGDKVAEQVTTTVTPPILLENDIFYENFETAGVKIGDKLKDTIGTAAAFGMIPTYDSNAKEGAKSIKCTLSEGKTANLGCKLYLTSDAKNKLVDGQTYTLSAYVYFDSQVSESGKVYIKTLNGTGAKEVVKGKAQTAKKGEWTLITNTFVYETEKYPDGLNIRIDTLEIGAGSFYYVDEVKISKGEGVAAATPSLKSELGDYKVLGTKVTDGHRPVPTNFETGKNFEDLLWFSEQKEYDMDKFLASLSGGEVVADDSVLFKDEFFGEFEQGKIEKIDVEGMPFSKAVRATVNDIGVNPYSFQIQLGNILTDKAKTGDILLLKVYMRTVSGGADESMNGKIQMIVEQNVSPHDKALQADVISTTDWTVNYLPFEFKNENYVRATIRLAYYEQVVDIGGYEIVNYKNQVKVEDLPEQVTNSSIAKDATWRKEAWDRIEKIRKGDFKVIVKDANGNVIPNAKVSFDMYEHEFKWGTAVSPAMLTNEKYQRALQENCNYIVLESEHKPRLYEEDPAAADNTVSLAKDLGIKAARGHCLVWDKRWNPEGLNTSTTDKFNEIINSGDKAALEAEIKRSIFATLERTKGTLTDWDVLNEGLRNDMRFLADDGHNTTEYGYSLIKKMYDWAREAGGDIDLYYNDYIMTSELITHVENMIAHGVDFDGVGLQTHNGYMGSDITTHLRLWDKIASLGKKVKITEFDVDTDDLNFQADFSRDMLIAAFSHEAVDGFVIWGMNTKEDIMYDSKFENAKPALKAWQDLIYNKWWTNESTQSNANGEATVRGFYGDYDITVTANGKSKTVSAPLYKANNNEIEIFLD